MLEAGIKGREEVMVTEANSAAAMGSGLLPVFATPHEGVVRERADRGGQKTPGVPRNLL